MISDAWTGKKAIFRSCITICFAVVMGFLVSKSDLSDKYHMNIDFWNQGSTYQTYGFAPSFVAFLQKMRVSRPGGYSEQKVETILGEYMEKSEATDEKSKNSCSSQQPTIITIMNESFSDLSALGHLECTKNDLKFFHSLKDNPRTIEFGWNYVSTRGGGTSTTEFEYLTGNSMAYVNGINPYSSFDFSGVPSMVSLLKEEGYRTIAMHPEWSANWRRSTVYPKLGFDEFLSIDSYEDSERTVWESSF